ncbi:MAG: site-specific integrase [Bacteriovoracaceae bacterium]|jgi:integrase|nr:site-specific integrase [Bacteriovoracaceae bacterium]
MKYKKVSGYVGIRKNLQSGMYEASKKIKGKTFSKTFKTIKEATYWRNTFNPFEKTSTESHQNNFLSFGDLWARYEEFHFPKLELSSQGIKKQKIAPFMNELKDMNIYDITPDFLEFLISKKKKQAKANPNSTRYNFDKNLDEIKAVLNWYQKNYDYKFYNPVLERHYVQGIIKKTVKKEKVLNQEQLINFLRAFDNPLYQDFAIVQFFCASRFGEIAGIQLKNIDLQNKSLLIKEVVVEDQSKKFLELKPYPKNGHPRVVAITSEIFEGAILRRLDYLKQGCNYLFHIDGNPLGYRKVQYQYNKALKRCGLFPHFSSTHILRYSMATESRRVMGSLDAAQAITGHHSIKMIEHYAKLPTTLQSDTVEKVGEELKKSWLKLEKLKLIN